MVKFDEFIKTLDPDIRVEVYDNKTGTLIHNGKLMELKNMPQYVLKIVPQSTSREVFLEIYTY